MAHAIAVVFGAYLTLSLATLSGFPLALSVLGAISGTILLMYTLQSLVYKPLRKRKVPSWQMLIVSLGVYAILQNVISLIWGDNLQTIRTWPVKPGHRFSGAYITDVQIIIVISSLSLTLFAWLVLERTRMGKEIRAVSENNELSQVFGISSNRAIVWSFAIGSALAACAGILIALDTDMTPTMGFNWLLYGVVAMIIGGMGKIHHLMLGALLLASTQHLAAYYLDSKWMNATAFILLILFLTWRPYGFSGRKLKKAEI